MISSVRLDERIAERFKVAVFVGIRKSYREMHTAFFIEGKCAKLRDLAVLADGLKHLPDQVRKAYADLGSSGSKSKKNKPPRRKPSK